MQDEPLNRTQLGPLSSCVDAAGLSFNHTLIIYCSLNIFFAQLSQLTISPRLTTRLTPSQLDVQGLYAKGRFEFTFEISPAYPHTVRSILMSCTCTSVHYIFFICGPSSGAHSLAGILLQRRDPLSFVCFQRSLN